MKKKKKKKNRIVLGSLGVFSHPPKLLVEI